MHGHKNTILWPMDGFLHDTLHSDGSDCKDVLAHAFCATENVTPICPMMPAMRRDKERNDRVVQLLKDKGYFFQGPILSWIISSGAVPHIGGDTTPDDMDTKRVLLSTRILLYQEFMTLLAKHSLKDAFFDFLWANSYQLKKTT